MPSEAHSKRTAAITPNRPLARKSPAGIRKTNTARAAGSTKASAPPVATAQVADKGKKPKLVRDGFTMPKDEFALIDAVKQRAARGGHPVKKSEVLRAGLALLASLDDKTLLAQLKKVPALKTGRPKKT